MLRSEKAVSQIPTLGIFSPTHSCQTPLKLSGCMSDSYLFKAACLGPCLMWSKVSENQTNRALKLSINTGSFAPLSGKFQRPWNLVFSSVTHRSGSDDKIALNDSSNLLYAKVLLFYTTNIRITVRRSCLRTIPWSFLESWKLVCFGPWMSFEGPTITEGSDR